MPKYKKIITQNLKATKCSIKILKVGWKTKVQKYKYFEPFFSYTCVPIEMLLQKEREFQAEVLIVKKR